METTELNNKIHLNLAKSYSIHFVFLLFGIVLDLLIPIRIFHNPALITLGLFLLILATVLIFWAQRTTRNLHVSESLSKEAFERGPYKFTRMPTHAGLFVLILGFGIIVNAFFVVLTTILSFLFCKFSFLKKYEEALVEKYGESYAAYKKEVRL